MVKYKIYPKYKILFAKYIDLPIVTLHCGNKANYIWKWARYCYTATPICYTDLFKLGAEAVPNRKPRSEWRGWETSFKSTLLLRAEGAIRAFFDGYCRGDTASGVRNVTITRRQGVMVTLSRCGNSEPTLSLSLICHNATLSITIRQSSHLVG